MPGGFLNLGVFDIFFVNIAKPHYYKLVSVYLFDVDGTLTEPRQRMSTSFLAYFLNWAHHNDFFLVAGSDMGKVNEQMPYSILSRAKGIFCCMGNEFYLNDGKTLALQYKNEFKAPLQLINILLYHQMYTQFPVRVRKGGRGAIIEHRTGMINFTTIGRNAGTEEREDYYLWDKEHNERARIIKELNRKFPDLEASAGGQISIDITPKGYNKSQASKWVRENLKQHMIFIGDKVERPGNDYDIAKDIIDNKDGDVHETTSPTYTLDILNIK